MVLVEFWVEILVERMDLIIFFNVLWGLPKKNMVLVEFRIAILLDTNGFHQFFQCFERFATKKTWSFGFGDLAGEVES